jgi:hypothetical protein
MKELKLVLFPFFLVLTLNACIYDGQCRDMLQLQKNEQFQSDLRDWFESIAEEPDMLQGMYVQNRLEFYYLLDKDIGIDLSKYGIPKKHVTFGFFGSNLDNEKFEYDKTEFFVIGYRYRHNLYLKMPHIQSFPIESTGLKKSDFVYVDESFGVVCP